MQATPTPTPTPQEGQGSGGLAGIENIGPIFRPELLEDHQDVQALARDLEVSEKEMAYLDVEESWEIFARELLLRFEMFYRFSFAYQQYSKCKKRIMVYRGRMELTFEEQAAEIRKLQDQLKVATGDGAELKKEKTDMQGQIADRDKKIKDLSKQISDMQWRIEYLLKQLDAIRAEKDEERRQVEAELNEERIAHENLQKEVDKGKKVIDQLRKEAFALEMKISDLEKEVDRTKDYDILKPAVEEKTSRILELEKELEDGKRYVAMAKGEVDEARAKVLALKTQVESVKKQRDKVLAEAEEREKKLSDELRECIEKYNKLLLAGSGQKPNADPEEQQMEQTRAESVADDLHKQLRIQLGMVLHDDAKVRQGFQVSLSHLKKANQRGVTRASSDKNGSAEDWGAELKEVEESSKEVFLGRQENVANMERKLEMIPLTTLQLMAEVEEWKEKYEEIKNLLLEQRQTNEAQQRALEKLQSRLITAGATSGIFQKEHSDAEAQTLTFQELRDLVYEQEAGGAIKASENANAELEQCKKDLAFQKERAMNLKRQLAELKKKSDTAWEAARMQIEDLNSQVTRVEDVKDPREAEPEAMDLIEELIQLENLTMEDGASQDAEPLLPVSTILQAITQVYSGWWKGPEKQSVSIPQALWRWARGSYGLDSLAEKRVRELLRGIKGHAGTRGMYLRIRIFAQLVGLRLRGFENSPPHHLGLYLKSLAQIPLAANSIPPNSEEARGFDGSELNLPPRARTFLEAHDTEDICWITLEAAVESLKALFRSDSNANLTPFIQLLRQHAEQQIRPKTQKTGGMVSVDYFLEQVLVFQKSLDSKDAVQNAKPLPKKSPRGKESPMGPSAVLETSQPSSTPEEMRLEILRQAFGKGFMQIVHNLLSEIQIKSDSAAALHCYNMLLSAVDASHRAVLTFSKDIITGMQLGRPGTRDGGMKKLSVSLPSAPTPPSSVTVIPGAPWVLPSGMSGVAEHPGLEGLREGPRPMSARTPSSSNLLAGAAGSNPKGTVYRRRPSQDHLFSAAGPSGPRSRPSTARPALSTSSQPMQPQSTTPRGTPSGPQNPPQGALSVTPSALQVGFSAPQPPVGNMFGMRTRESPIFSLTPQLQSSSVPQPPGAKRMRPQSAAPNPKRAVGTIRYGTGV